MFEGNPEWRFSHIKKHMAFVPKGFIRYYILRLLNEKPMSGSEIIQHVEEKSEGRWRPSPGSVYPLLAWLQEKGYIKEVPAQEPGIKRYSLTDEGKEFLQEHEKRRNKMEERFKSFGPGSFFEAPWLTMPGHIRDVMKADLELHNAMSPNSVQEMCDLTVHAFEVADRYRTPVYVLADGALGQMMEPIEIPQAVQNEPEKPWAVVGNAATRKNLITSIYLEHDKQEILITKLEEKYEEIQKNEVLFQEIQTEDAEILIIAFGISSRIARAAVETSRADGVAVGLLRPISLYPFPSKRLRQLAGKAYSIMVLELSSGQLIEDVRLSVGGITPVQLLRRTGGMMPSAEDVVQALKKMEKECVGNRA